MPAPQPLPAPTSAEHADCLVVGAGITGLTLAFYLQRLGVRCIVAESSNRVGGAIATRRSADGFQWEEGPNSFRPTAATLQLVADVGLEDRLMLSNPSLPRYIYWDGSLHAVPTSLRGALSSDFSLLTRCGKARAALGLAWPPWLPLGGQEADESVRDYVTRRFGREAFERVFDAVVAGVCAGDSSKLSMRAAFPDAARAIGSQVGPQLLSKALATALTGPRQRHPPATPEPAFIPSAPPGATASFVEGLSVLPEALACALGPPCVRTGHELVSLDRAAGEPAASMTQVLSSTRSGGGGGGGGYECRLRLRGGGGERVIHARAVALTVPAHALAAVRGVSAAVPAAVRLRGVRYPPLASVSLAYPVTAFRRPLAGLGHLVPRGAGVRSLGTIWASSAFPGRAPTGFEVLTTFIGGAQDESVAALSEGQLAQLADEDIRRVLLTPDAPTFKFLGCRLWPRALPQAEVGHTALLRELEASLACHPTLALCGSYRSGAALGDCVRAAHDEAHRLAGVLSMR